MTPGNLISGKEVLNSYLNTGDKVQENYCNFKTVVQRMMK